MYNTDIPTRAELPTSAQLLRSTVIAVGAALAILVAIVLPSEYAIDPTGVGRALGLTKMGEIKTQLAAEAAADARADAAALEARTQAPAAEKKASAEEHGHSHAGDETHAAAAVAKGSAEAHGHLHDDGAAHAVVAADPTAQAPVAAASGRSDKVSVVLRPGQGAEVKMAMAAGAKAAYDWSANGAVVNFDAHGDGKGRSTSYKKGKGAGQDSGEIVAAFDGYHGWFWRNRTDKEVTLTLRTKGDYKEIKRME
nr:transmembrane anchor protein [uncultured Cupriavidus sp.]